MVILFPFFSFNVLEVTTVEGVINRSIAGLEQDQPVRRIQHPEAAAQIDEFIKKLEKLKELSSPFTLVGSLLIKVYFYKRQFRF